MPETFNPPKPPSVNGFNMPEVANHVRVTFEGQYSQRAKKGPNAISRKGTVTFTNLTLAQRDEILSFLRAREGVEAFYFQLPGDSSPVLWTCAKWRSPPEKNKVDWRLTMNLIEEFDII